jgi:hypothetical protein
VARQNSIRPRKAGKTGQQGTGSCEEIVPKLILVDFRCAGRRVPHPTRSVGWETTSPPQVSRGKIALHAVPLLHLRRIFPLCRTINAGQGESLSGFSESADTKTLICGNLPIKRMESGFCLDFVSQPFAIQDFPHQLPGWVGEGGSHLRRYR